MLEYDATSENNDFIFDSIVTKLYNDTTAQSVVVLVRGLPGSGKSHFARELLQRCEAMECCIAEADSYFMQGSEYHFDSRFLPDAHKQSFEKFKRCLLNGSRAAIVSNTFTQSWEMYDYINHCYQNNYSLIVVNTSLSHSDEYLQHKNLHNVPLQKISDMRQRFQPIKSGFWSSSDILSFIINENTILITDRFIGRGIELSTVLEASKFVTVLLRKYPIEKLIKSINNLHKRNSKNRRHSEFHLTIVPPNDREKVSEEQLLQLKDILFYSVKILIIGCGFVEKDETFAIYFTLEENGIRPIREWMNNCGLDGSKWSPHITIGFFEEDIHDILKPPMDTSFADIASVDDVNLCKCLLHPQVKVNFKVALQTIPYVDIRVHSIPGMSDDLTYSRYPELLTLVTRGLVYYSLETTSHWVCVLRGITKFTGTIGNDDDISLTDLEASELLGSFHLSASNFRVSQKENGRSGGFSVVQPLCLPPSQYVVCVGTKLSHVFTYYDTEKKAMIIEEEWKCNKNMVLLVRNLQAFEDLLRNVEDIQQVLDLLENHTMNVEVLDCEDQHIERIEDGCLTAVCLNVVRADTGRYDPLLLEKLRVLGVRTVYQNEVIQPMENFAKAIKEMKWDRKEGYVVQFLNKEGDVLGLLKVKCLWYIVVRAIREVTRNRLLGSLRARTEYMTKMKRIVDKLVDEKHVEVKKLRQEEMRQKTKQWCKDVAQEVCDWIPKHWQHKFDFLQADIEDLELIIPKIINLACSFLMWYASLLDLEFVSIHSSDEKSDLDKADEVEKFSSTFPLIWDDFIAVGMDESFLFKQ